MHCCNLQNIMLQQDSAVIFCAVLQSVILPLCSQRTNLIMHATITFFFEFVLGSKPQLDQSVHFASSKGPVIWSRLVLFWISEEWRNIQWIWPQLI